MIRCSKCTKFITNKNEGTYMIGRKWHLSCFCCDSCGVRLYYGDCFEKLGRLLCPECNLKANGPNEGAMFMAKWKKALAERKNRPM